MLRLKKWSILLLVACAGSAMAANVTLQLLNDNFCTETSFSMIFDPGGANTPVAFDSPAEFGGFVATGDLSSTTNYLFEWDLANGDYVFTIFDSFGDGICCGFGVGNYALTTPTGVTNGGEFADAEAISFSITDNNGSPNPVPEPSTLVLLGLGLGGLGAFRLRQRRKA